MAWANPLAETIHRCIEHPTTLQHGHCVCLSAISEISAASFFMAKGSQRCSMAWRHDCRFSYTNFNSKLRRVFIFFLFPEERGLTQGSAVGSWHIPNMKKYDRSILLLCAVIAVTTFLIWFMSLFIVHSFIFGNSLLKWFQNPVNCCLPEPSGSKIPSKPKTTFDTLHCARLDSSQNQKLPIASLFAYRKANQGPKCTFGAAGACRFQIQAKFSSHCSFRFAPFQCPPVLSPELRTTQVPLSRSRLWHPVTMRATIDRPLQPPASTIHHHEGSNAPAVLAWLKLGDLFPSAGHLRVVWVEVVWPRAVHFRLKGVHGPEGTVVWEVVEAPSPQKLNRWDAAKQTSSLRIVTNKKKFHVSVLDPTCSKPIPPHCSTCQNKHQTKLRTLNTSGKFRSSACK